MKILKICKKSLALLSPLLLMACERYPGTIQITNSQKPEWQSKIEKFANCTEVKQYISKYQESSRPSANWAQPAMASDQNQAEHYQNQVDGVIEGDILQASSEYFFFVRDGFIEVTRKHDLKKIKSLPLESQLQKKQLVYQNGQLIFIGSNQANTRLKIFAVDTDFQLIRDETIKGDLRDFRVNENQLVLVSEFYFSPQQSEQSCDQIYHPNWLDGSNQITHVTQVDLSNPKEPKHDIGIMGQTDYIYMTQQQLLLFRNYPTPHFRVVDWKNNKLHFNQVEKLSGMIKDQTAVHIADDLLFVALTERPEWLALSEPMATVNSISSTSTNSSPAPDAVVNSISVRKNRIVVYNRNDSSSYIFKGATSDFGINEDIRAVKFLKQYAYVVTFQKTDPLFVIDLQDPNHLQIRGELKVPGFSTQLKDLGGQILGGLGFDATEDSNFAWIAGLKFSLFDVSIPEKPLELDHLIFGDRGSYSEATANAKALYYNSQTQKVIFPAVILTTQTQIETGYYQEALQFAGAIILTSNQGQLTERGRISHQDWREKYCGKNHYAPIWSSSENASSDIQRTLEFENSIYSFSRFGVVKYSTDTLLPQERVEYDNSTDTCATNYYYGAM